MRGLNPGIAAARDRAARAAGYGSHREFIDAVREAADCGDIAVRWGGLTLRPAGGSWMVCCPFHDDATPSLHLNGSVFCCHGSGCGAQGDAITLAMRLSGLGFPETVDALAAEYGLACPEPAGRRRKRRRAHLKDTANGTPVPRPPAEITARPPTVDTAPQDSPDRWPAAPPPADAALPAGRDPGRRSMGVWFRGGVRRLAADRWHAYRGADGRLLGFSARIMHRGGGKSVLPVTWRKSPEGGGVWAVLGWHPMRPPLYGLETLRGRGAAALSVLIVEGEKTADAARTLLAGTGWAAVSPPGGARAARRAGWDALAREIEREAAAGGGLIPAVAVWPDADRRAKPEDRLPAVLFADAALSGLADCLGGEAEFIRRFAPRAFLPPEGLKHGWDLADALSEGWTPRRALAALAASPPWTGTGSGWDLTEGNPASVGEAA